MFFRKSVESYFSFLLGSLSLTCFSLMGRQPHCISNSVVSAVQCYSHRHHSHPAFIHPHMQSLLSSSRSHLSFDLKPSHCRYHCSFLGRSYEVPIYKIYSDHVPSGIAVWKMTHLFNYSFSQSLIHPLIQPTELNTMDQSPHECWRYTENNTTRCLLSSGYLPMTAK